MIQILITMVALEENPGVMSSTHGNSESSVTPIPRDLISSSGFYKIRGIYMVHSQRNPVKSKLAIIIILRKT